MLFFAELLGTPSMDWYAFALNAGAVAMVGLLFAEIVSLLGMTLADEREQRRQLALEKARSETLLQKEAKDALRIAELRFRAVFDQPLLSVQICDPDGTMSQWNQATAKFYGVSPEALAL